jgi:monoamine oxidase
LGFSSLYIILSFNHLPMKTTLLKTLKRAFQLALLSENQDMSIAELFEKKEAQAYSRRKFLKNTTQTALASAFMVSTEGVLSSIFSKINKPKIAIIGGGMAGLTALHHLKKVGLDATIYESSGRLGGRIFTVKEAMGTGTWAEFGAEFIDTNHADMWALAKEFNLELIDYQQESELKLHAEAFFFNGRHYTLKEVIEGFKSIAPRLKKDIDNLPEEINYKSKNPFVKRLDNTSLSAYLSQIGARGWIKRLIEVAYESEYGLSPQVQSCLNLLTLISPDVKDKIEWFGESDERYKIRGGNQSIINALAEKYQNHIHINQSLESIRKGSGAFFLKFSGKSEDIKADMVIMTIPFTKLRLIDIRVPMPQVKWDSINTLGYGTNAKLMLGMDKHLWREQGYSGLVYADNGIPNGWDNAQLQTTNNEAAGLSILFGGEAGVAVGRGSVEYQKNIYLPKWEQIYKGVTATYNGKLARMHWPSYPHSLCSYICPRVGQYTTIVGAEQFPVGNLYFAGEHCGGDFAGFMNGAAQSGREAAEAILTKVK